MHEFPRPFGQFGSEKMIYDIRMGPQCLHHDGSYYAVYQASQAGGKALPHIISRNDAGVWSAPVVLGDVARWDHHYAPILWIDQRGRIHVLYHCHFALNEVCHKISTAPLNITDWTDGPPIAPSISYPRMLKDPTGRLILYYRALGHMGYWTYRASEDGGMTWTGPAVSVVDFDYLPEIPGDEWAGSYHSVVLGNDAQSIHLAFVRWDERDQIVNPVYGQAVGLQNRYDLYYARLDLRSGRLANIKGEPLDRPLNRRRADQHCQILNTGWRITNMPSILADPHDLPQLLAPVAEDALDQCSFWFIRWTGEEWSRRRITGTDSIWNGSHLEYAPDGGISAFLIASPPCAGDRFYGGGLLQEWRSGDQGETWRHAGDIALPEGHLCNNPKPVEDASGVRMKRSLSFFGWKGSDSIPADGPCRGMSYLWNDGNWL